MDFSRLLDPIRRQIRMIVAKCLIQSVNDAKAPDGLSATIGLVNSEKHESVPMMQNYGLTSKPKANSRAVVLFVGGARDNGVIVATQGPADKIPTLEDGEVAVYSDYGQSIILKKDGSILAKPASGKPYRFEGDLNVIGKILTTDEIAAKYMDQNGSLIPGPQAVHMTTHVHASAAPGAPSPATPGT